jgi:hypothetical protein
LLGSDETLAVLGARGALRFDGATWRAMNDDVVATRAFEVVAL